MLLGTVISALWAAQTISASLSEVHQQRLFDGSVSVDVDRNLVLDSTVDGILEVISPEIDEPETYLELGEEEEEGTQTTSAGRKEVAEHVGIVDSEARFALSQSPWAVSYTPYTSAGECKDSEEMHEDALAMVRKGFKAVRLFSTDCNVLPALEPAAHAQSLGLIPTVYISEDGINESAEEQLDDILEFAQWDLIRLVVLGSEAVLYEHTTAENLAVFLQHGTKRLRAAGYSGPVTTMEHPTIIKQHAETLCSHLHVLASSAQPFFDGSIEAGDTGNYIQRELSQLEVACGDRRDGYILATGWPNKGKSNGVAIAGREEQRTAIANILAVASSRVALSTFEDEMWREPGLLSSEQFWGCGHLFNGSHT